MFTKYSDFKYLGKTLDKRVDGRLPLKLYARVTKTSGLPFFRKSETIVVYRSYISPYWKELDTGKLTNYLVEQLADCFEANIGKEMGDLPDLYPAIA